MIAIIYSTLWLDRMLDTISIWFTLITEFVLTSTSWRMSHMIKGQLTGPYGYTQIIPDFWWRSCWSVYCFGVVFYRLVFFWSFFGMASSICHRPKTQFIHFKSYLKKFKWKNKLFKAKSSNLAVTPHARFVNIRRIGATRIKHFISKKKAQM